jgi:hypothetical protein
VSIFANKKLLDDVKISDNVWVITGHAKGAEIILDEVGKFHDFDAMYSKDASCNVLCQYDVMQICDTFEIPDWGIRVLTSAGPLDFVLQGKRYVLDTRNKRRLSEDEFHRKWVNQIKNWSERVSKRCLVGETRTSISRDGKTVTVASQAAKYTAAERKRAKEAINLIRTSGFYSPNTLMDMLENGGIANCPLTRSDLERGIDIEGRPTGYWQGKLHDKKSGQLILEKVLPPLTKKHQIAHCDIMHIGQKKYFVAVINPMNLAVADAIENTSVKSLQKSIEKMVNLLAKRGLLIHSIIHDPERGFGKVSANFPNINFQPTDVDGHVVIAERLIEEIKEIMRSVITICFAECLIQPSGYICGDQEKLCFP